MLQSWWDRIPDFLKNRYIITTFLFLLWMLFFDQNDIISQVKLKNQLHQLNKDKEYYQEQIEVTQSELENLLNDNEKLERFAREKYLMKKPDEDLFVIVYEED